MDLSIIEQQISKGEEISPFFFVSANLEILHNQLEGYIKELFLKYGIDAQDLFHIQDDGEKLKLEQVRNYISKGDVAPRFGFQVFFIENCTRMTVQSANACLKFFEEPGKGNIIILTGESESGVLDTILSRVQVIHMSSTSDLQSGFTGRELRFYISMIQSHREEKSDELVRYFFSGKYEKDEYISFLYGFIEYIRETGEYVYLLDEIHEDIGGIMKNNLQGRYIIDKYIMLL